MLPKSYVKFWLGIILLVKYELKFTLLLNSIFVLFKLFFNCKFLLTFTFVISELWFLVKFILSLALKKLISPVNENIVFPAKLKLPTLIFEKSITVVDEFLVSVKLDKLSKNASSPVRLVSPVSWFTKNISPTLNLPTSSMLL